MVISGIVVGACLIATSL